MEKQIIKEVQESFESFLNTISSFSEEEINRIPFEGSWTGAQLTSHLTKSHGGGLFLLQGETKASDRDPMQYAERIRGHFLDFTVKFNAPDRVKPETKEYEKKELTQSFKEITSRIVDVAENMDLSRICMAFLFQPYGYLSGMEVLTFINVHTRRHHRQLENIFRIIKGQVQQIS
ncbi:MAG: DinB family protein [Flavisolibacter sp.]